MILVGNQRGGAYDLARHLMKDENERVTVHDMRGFVSGSLEGAFQESFAISRATKCKQHLYSLSLNPPKGADVSEDQYLDAIQKVEDQLGFQNQPRAIVFHEKLGQDGKLRRHAHAVWCRIDRKAMVAINMSFDKDKLRSVARGLFIEHGWKMPLGFIKTEWRNPHNFTLEEWQQAKRAGKDAKKLKAMFQERWAISDSKASFANALAEQGFILAKGDRRGIVAVDHDGEAYAITRWVGLKAKQVRARLGEPDSFPTVASAHKKAANLVIARLEDLEREQERLAKEAKQTAEQNLRAKTAAQKRERLRLRQDLARRERHAEKKREARLRGGLLGFIDRLTGRRKKTLALNQAERETNRQLQRAEQAQLRAIQEKSIETAQAKNARQAEEYKTTTSELQKDLRWLKTPFKEASKGRHRSARARTNNSDPELRDMEPEP